MQQKQMLITKSLQRAQNGGTFSTFQMIPLTADCPYINCIYDINASYLVCFTKEKKDYVQTVPKINEYGEPATKNGKPLAERRTIPDYFEIHITDAEDIQNFINNMALNHENVGLYLPYISQIKINDPNKMEDVKAIITPY